MKAHLVTDVRKAAMDLLARREHSAFELKRKLLDRGCALEMITTAIFELQKENLQSDQRFVECFVRFRADRGFGPLRIRAELRDRGILEELIRANLDEKIESWLDLAAKIRAKKFGSCVPKNFSERMRQMRFLKYKGFNSEQIKFALGVGVDIGEEM